MIGCTMVMSLTIYYWWTTNLNTCCTTLVVDKFVLVHLYGLPLWPLAQRSLTCLVFTGLKSHILDALPIDASITITISLERRKFHLFLPWGFDIVTSLEFARQISWFNSLVKGHLYIINVSQELNIDHPCAVDIVREDCVHVSVSSPPSYFTVSLIFSPLFITWSQVEPCCFPWYWISLENTG